MKLKLSVLLMFATFSVIGQTYYPLVDTGKVWYNLTGYVSIPINEYTEIIKFTDEVTLDGKIYRKVMLSYDTTLINWSHIGYIRETPSKSVFYRSITDTAEIGLYHFGVGVGDTIWVQDPGTQERWLVVESIDYIPINNANRRRIRFKSTIPDPFYWIEGIGCLSGILKSAHFDWIGTYDHLLCYYDNDTLMYTDSNYTDCFIQIAVNENKPPETRVKVFPNPVTTTSHLVIQNYNANECRIEFFNALGRKVLSTKIEGNKHLINKSDLGTGIFFYRITSTNNQQLTGKIIIQ